MATLIGILDTFIFSGLPSNAAWDLIKVAWSKITHRSWEELYLEAFQKAVKDERHDLKRYVGTGGEVSLDRDVLRQVLHYDLAAAVSSMSLSSLSSDQFVDLLASKMAEREAIVIGGHTLPTEDYARLVRRVVHHAKALFQESVSQNEEAFQQALVIEALENQTLLREAKAFLETSSEAVKARLAEQSQQLHDLSIRTTEIKEALDGLATNLSSAFSFGLTPYSVMALGEIPLPDDPPYRPITFVPRDSLTESLAQHLASGTTWLALVDGPGMGKTQLALRLEESLDPQVTCWISLRDKEDPRAYVNSQLARWLSNLTSDGVYWNLFTNGKLSLFETANLIASAVRDSGILLIDDLPEPRGRHPFYEALGQVCAAFMSQGAKLITTGQWPLPPNLVADLAVHVSSVPPFTETEVLAFLEQAGAPKNLQSLRIAEFIRIGTAGIPSLVAATVHWLRAREWQLEEEDLTAILVGTPAQETRRTSKERLVGFLANDPKRLLYRLSLLWHPFDMPLALGIASIPPTIEYPAECFESLTSPWLEVLPNDKYQVTPLLKGSGKSNIDDDITRLIYMAALDQFLNQDCIAVSDVGTIATYYWAAGDYVGFVSFLIQTMTHVTSVERARYLDAVAFVTRLLPPEKEWPEGVKSELRILFRMHQIRLCVLVGCDPTSLDADLQGLLTTEPENEAEALAMFLACVQTSVMLSYLPAIDALERAFQALQLIYSWKLDRLIDAQAIHEGESGSAEPPQFEDMIWNVVFRLEGCEEIEVLLLHIRRLTDEQQKKLLQAALAAEAFSFVVDRLWMKESDLPALTRNWDDIYGFLDHVRATAELIGSPLLDIVQARARAIVLADYHEEFDNATTSLEVVFAGDDPALKVLKHYTLGNSYFDAGELDQATKHYSIVVTSQTDSFGYYRLSAQKHLAVIYGKQDNLQEAKANCIAALRLASFSAHENALRLYDRLEMIGELAWIAWASGYPKKACGAMFGLVMDLTKYGNDSEPRYRELYNKAGHALGWFTPIANSGKALELTSDGSPYTPVEAGFMGQVRTSLQKYQGPSGFSKAMLLSLAGLLAVAVGLDRLAWRAFQQVERVLELDDPRFLFLSSNVLAPSLATRFGNLDDAISLGIKTARAYAVSQSLDGVAEYNSQQADFVLERWSGFSEAEKRKAERLLICLVLGPAFMEQLRVGLGSPDTRDFLDRCKLSIQRNRGNLVEPEFWDRVLAFLECIIESHYSSRSTATVEVNVSDEEPLLKALHYLASSELPSTALDDSLRMQVFSADYILRLHSLGRQMHLSLGEFLHDFWSSVAKTRGFAIRSPQLFREQILGIPTNLGTETIVRVLRSACFALRAVLPPDISERFGQALAASGQDQ